MTTIATLAVKLIADAASFISMLDQAEKKTQTWSQNVSKTLKNVGGNITDFGSKATTYLTLPLMAGGIAALNYASDLEETKSKATVIFGEMADELFKWSSTSASSFGQSQRQALDAASNFAIFGSAANLTRDDLLNFSKTNTELASDLASFFNTSPEEAITALGAAYRGESEPIRRYGVLLNQAAVAAKAVEMGLVEANVDMVRANGLLLDAEKAQSIYNEAVRSYGVDSFQAREAAQTMTEIQQKLDDVMSGTYGEISSAARIQATYALVMEQTSAAQGDFARTAEGMANQTRSVRAQFEDAAAALGVQLLPYALQLIQWVSRAISWFEALTPQQQKWIVGFLAIAAAVGPLLVVIGSLITAVGAIVGVIGAITTPVLIVIGVIAALIAIGVLLYQAWTNNWGGIQQKTAEATEFIKGIVNGVMTFINDLTSGNLGAVSEIWNRTWSTISMYVGTILSNIQLIIGAFQAALSGDWYRFGQMLRMVWDNSWRMIGIVISTAGANIKTAVVSIATNALTAMKNFNWADAGKNIVLGIRNGILNNVSFAVSAVQSMGQAVMDAIKGFFGIASPAKLLQKEVAPWLVKGAFDWTPFVNRSLFQPAFARVPGITAGLMRESTAKSNGGITLMNYGTVMMPEGGDVSNSLLRQLG